MSSIVDPFVEILKCDASVPTPRLSVLIPTYKGRGTIRETLESIVFQKTDFEWEVVICNDGSSDLDCGLFDGLPKIFQVLEFSNNVGYPANLQRCFDHARGRYLLLLGQDDLIARGYLQRVVQEFESSPDIGVISRSYFWFMDSLNRPVRAKATPKIYEGKSHTDVRSMSSYSDWRLLVDSLDQLSGLAFRKETLRLDVGGEIFTAHIIPFLDIATREGARFLHCYPVAVRIDSSQSRNVSSIYDTSPVSSWIRLIEQFESTSPQVARLRRFIGENHIGLLQIRNYSRRPIAYVVREALLMIKVSPRNIVSLRFWSVFVACILIPKSLLRQIVDRLKPLSMIRHKDEPLRFGSR